MVCVSDRWVAFGGFAVVEREREFVRSLDLLAEGLKVRQKGFANLLEVTVRLKILVFKHFLGEESEVGFQHRYGDFENPWKAGFVGSCSFMLSFVQRLLRTLFADRAPQRDVEVGSGVGSAETWLGEMMLLQRRDLLFRDAFNKLLEEYQALSDHPVAHIESLEFLFLG